MSKDAGSALGEVIGTIFRVFNGRISADLLRLHHMLGKKGGRMHIIANVCTPYLETVHQSLTLGRKVAI
jgi:hypothetical protein